MAKAKSKEIETNSKAQDKQAPSIFEKEISRLPEELKKKLLVKYETILPFIEKIKEKTQEKSMGFYVVPEFEIKDNIPMPNFDKLSLNFLFDDFEKSLISFNPRVLLANDFDKLLVEEKKKIIMVKSILNTTLKKIKI